jgi:hypothetical protein
VPPNSDYVEVFLTHRAALIESATPLVGCRSRAEDIVQEAFIKFTEFVNRGEVQHPVAFLFRIVRSLAVDRWRRLILEIRTGADQEIPEEVSSQALSPEETVIQRDELRVVARRQAAHTSAAPPISLQPQKSLLEQKKSAAERTCVRRTCIEGKTRYERSEVRHAAVWHLSVYCPVPRNVSS